MSPGAPTRSQRPLGKKKPGPRERPGLFRVGTGRQPRVPVWNSYDAFALTADNPNPVVASV
jgi:hypothetical protein